MSRVLHIFRTYFPETVGGVEQVIHETVSSTREMGFDCEVFTYGCGATDTIDYCGYPVHRIKAQLDISGFRGSWGAFSKVAELASNADLIHHHFPNPGGDLLALQAAGWKKRRIPLITTYHSDVVRQKKLNMAYAPLREKFLSRVDRIVATSPRYADSSSLLQRFRKKVDVVPLGLPFSTGTISSEGSSEEIPEKVRRLGSGGFFLFVGMLRYYKGLHTLLEAAQKVSMPIVIAGDGPLRSEIEQIVSANQLDHVSLTGRISDSAKFWLLENCAAFVFPSHLRSEAFGVSLLEASAFGKPMISCEIGTGTSYVNLDGETGFVISPGSPEQLADKMSALWNDQDTAVRFGKQARKRFEDNFTSDRVGRKYAQLYEKLLAG